MKIKVISIAKQKFSSFQTAEEEYLKRCQRFAKIELSEINSSKLSKFQGLELANREAELITAKLNSNDFVIALDEYGKQFSTMELKGTFEKLMQQSPNIVFIVGGPQGLAPDLLKRANLKLSLSKLTFTSEQSRMILIEQIYRVFSIIKGLPYHKGDLV